MSIEQQHAIDEAEYRELVKAVGDSGLSALEKDNLRELLSAGYRNLNGDPMETKVKLLARTDWIQIKRTLADSDRMQRILSTLDEIKARLDTADSAPRSFSAQLFAFLKAAKAEIATVVCFAIFFPNGAAVLKVLSTLVRGE